MLRRTYERQKAKTRTEVWQDAKAKAEEDHAYSTADEFVSEVISEIRQSEIEIFEDYVPVEFDDKRDEVYFSREKVPRFGHDSEQVWFVTESDDLVVQSRLSTILREFNVNLGLVTSEDNDDGTTRYEIKIPFITDDERKERIREDTLDYARDMRTHKDVDEDDIIGDCPNEGCEGKQYRNGMGSCGPKYECTRFGCGFMFVKDVL